MKHFNIALLIARVACNRHSGNSEITEVILPDSKKNPQEFLLSELVDDVGYIKLETKNECIVTRPRYDVSDNYILISNQYQPGQVMLFRRDGTLKALIGKEGKGPGEYTRNDPRVRISNNEEYQNQGLDLQDWSRYWPASALVSKK